MINISKKEGDDRIVITHPTFPVRPGVTGKMEVVSLQDLNQAQQIITGLPHVVMQILAGDIAETYITQQGLDPLIDVIIEATKEEQFPADLSDQILYILGKLTQEILSRGITLSYKRR